MNQRSAFVRGFGLGAGLGYLVDAMEGRRRRASSLRDARNRAEGLAAETSARFMEDWPSNRVLVDRIRSRMGHYVSRPDAVRVAASEGRVWLSGAVPAEELDDLLECVRSVRGVLSIENRLELTDGRTGTRRRRPRRPPGDAWPPAMRLVAGATGGLLLGLGSRRDSRAASLLKAMGLDLVSRSTALALPDEDLRRLLGIGTGRRGVVADRMIVINAPRADVFRTWSAYENFPRFMSHVREVRDLGNGRSRWVVDGPAGLPVSWDAVVTRFEPNQVIAWKSVNSPIRNAGIIHFEPTALGGTHVRMRLSYNPPAGFFGHLAAMLAGANPKHALRDDLRRFKAFIEAGASRDVAPEGSPPLLAHEATPPVG